MPFTFFRLSDTGRQVFAFRFAPYDIGIAAYAAADR
jgi:hypothetical protein